jgi:hypothetical protein
VLALLVLVVLYRAVHRRVQRMKRERTRREEEARASTMAAKRETLELSTINEALLSTTLLRHPAVLIAATDFLELGQLRRFEDLRDCGSLHFCDTMAALLDESRFFYIFLSHQWTSWSAPDPSGTQYAIMQSAVRHVSEKYGWPIETVMVWVDYASIPQRNENAMNSAIVRTRHSN